MPDNYELIYLPPNAYNGRPASVVAHRSEMPNEEARFAMALLERWALVAARDGGEDSSGRQKLRDMPPAELAAAACETAAATFAEIRTRGWMIDLPDMATIEERARAENGKN